MEATRDSAEFEIDKEFLINTLRTGYYKNSPDFKDLEVFPYRQDNKPIPIKTLLYENVSFV